MNKVVIKKRSRFYKVV